VFKNVTKLMKLSALLLGNPQSITML